MRERNFLTLSERYFFTQKIPSGFFFFNFDSFSVLCCHWLLITLRGGLVCKNISRSHVSEVRYRASVWSILRNQPPTLFTAFIFIATWSPQISVIHESLERSSFIWYFGVDFCFILTGPTSNFWPKQRGSIYLLNSLLALKQKILMALFIWIHAEYRHSLVIWYVSFHLLQWIKVLDVVYLHLTWTTVASGEIVSSAYVTRQTWFSDFGWRKASKVCCRPIFTQNPRFSPTFLSHTVFFFLVLLLPVCEYVDVSMNSVPVSWTLFMFC